MNLMFLLQDHSLHSLVIYCSCHSNIKFISSRHCVISSIHLSTGRINRSGMYRACNLIPTNFPSDGESLRNEVECHGLSTLNPNNIIPVKCCQNPDSLNQLTTASRSRELLRKLSTRLRSWQNFAYVCLISNVEY